LAIPLTGCFATVSELKREKSEREALEAQFGQFKKEQRSRLTKLEEQAQKQQAQLQAQLAQSKAELAHLRKQNKELDRLVRQGQGGVAEMFSTLQRLQESFQKSIGQVDELQQQIKDMVQKQPEQEKKYQDIQKRYEELLKNQRSLAEQAIPAKFFARARDAYKAKKYDEALGLFKTFTQRFGTHPLADNAYLYIGDIHRQRKETSAAILAYKTILQKYPDESEMPKALFRLGLLHYQMGRCKAGKGYFLRLTRYTRQEPALAKDAKNFYRRSASLCRRR
jgi:TolA-binding protein